MNSMSYQSEMEERRITLRLLSYWERRRGSRRMPAEVDIDPADIADLWEYCFMAHTKDIGKPGYHFAYLGKTIKDVYHEGLKHTDADAPIFPDMETLAKGYQHVLTKCEPLVTNGEITNLHGDIFKYRQVLLPLGVGNTVQAVFGGMRFVKIVTYG